MEFHYAASSLSILYERVQCQSVDFLKKILLLLFTPLLVIYLSITYCPSQKSLLCNLVQFQLSFVSQRRPSIKKPKLTSKDHDSFAIFDQWKAENKSKSQKSPQDSSFFVVSPTTILSGSFCQHIFFCVDSIFGPVGDWLCGTFFVNSLQITSTNKPVRSKIFFSLYQACKLNKKKKKPSLQRKFFSARFNYAFLYTCRIRGRARRLSKISLVKLDIF